MTKLSAATVRAVAVLALAMAMAACGDDAEQAAEEVTDEARDTATTIADRVEKATRLTATLTGAEEVPQAGDPDGTGIATVNLDVTEGNLCYEVSVQNIDVPVGMHIHEGESGESGPVVVPLKTPTGSDTTTSGCADVDATVLGRIAANPGGFYVNVHTEPYPQGAVRGQLSQ